MVPLALMVATLLGFRLLGAAGVEYFASWQASMRHALAVMFLFTAVSHFTKTRIDLIRMVPALFPRPDLLVSFTGVCELAGAVGLLIPSLARLAAYALMVLLVAMFPANLRAARERLMIAGRRATPLWLRLPMQLFWIGALWWSVQDQPALAAVLG